MSFIDNIHYDGMHIVSNFTVISKRDTIVRIGPGAPAAVAGPSAAAPYIRSSPAILPLGAISGQTTARKKTNRIQRVHC